MNKNITKYIIAGVLVLAFVAYLIFANKDSSTVATVPTTPTTTNNSTTTDTGSGTPTSTGTGTTATTGQYKDGTYTGSVADAFYGKLQATVTISGGLITDVTFPQSPNDGESADVSARALPVLKAEAIAAQAANVNTVSGATQDTEAFNESLAVALSQAKN